MVCDVTPEIFFSDFQSAFPDVLGMSDLWRDESPSKRFGHHVELVLQRHLAFLDDNYSLWRA